MTTDWPRVGRYIRSRRKALGLTQAAMQSDGGPSPALLRQIENGEYDAAMHPSIRRAIEHKLTWVEGSIEAIHAGGEPTIADIDLQDEMELFRSANIGQPPEAAFALLTQWVVFNKRIARIEATYAERYGIESPEKARQALQELDAWIKSGGTDVEPPPGGWDFENIPTTPAQDEAFRLAAQRGKKEPDDEPQ